MNRRYAVIMVFVLLFALPLMCAQSQAPASPPASAQAAPTPNEVVPTFRSRSEYVAVPVLVTDTYGKHYAGLKKNDFVVKQNGKPQRIAELEEVKASATGPVSRVPVPPGVFTNQLQIASPKRVIILVFDTINTPLMGQSYALAELLQAVEKGIAPGELISLISAERGGGVRVLHDFTTDSQALVAALNQLRPQTNILPDIQASHSSAMIWQIQADVASLTSWEQGLAQRLGGSESLAAVEQRRIQVLDTLNALQQIADAYAGVPGRKELLWATAGFPFTLGGDLSNVEALVPSYERVWQALSEANISVYPIDVRGLTNPNLIGAEVNMPRNPISGGTSPQAIDRLRNSQMDEFADTISTMDMFAGMTGGKAFYNTNDIAGAVQKASDDSASYYVIGYYLDKDTKPGWQKVKVQVTRSGTNVRARTGFFVSPALSPDATRQSDLRQALLSPIDFTAFPLVVRWREATKVPGSTRQSIKFQIAVPAGAAGVDEKDGNRLRLDFVAAAFDSAGNLAGQSAHQVDNHLNSDVYKQFREQSTIFEYSIDLPPGKYSVRFVGRDDSNGHTGSVTAPLKVD
jgi:VWFA-related protein